MRRWNREERSWAVSWGAGVLVGGLLLNLPIGLLTNWASNHPEQLPRPLQFVSDEPWVPLAVVTVLSIICSFVAARSSQRTAHDSASGQVSTTRRLLIRRMAEQLDDLLARGANMPRPLELAMVPVEWAVDRQRPSFMASSRNTAEILEAYDLSGRALLVLGGPGSGKTRLLGALSRLLASRAELHRDEPVPILLDLTSWQHRQQFDEWIIAETNRRYAIPKSGLRHLLLTASAVTLVFDGLDESEKPDDCLVAINDFRQRLGHDVVVGCREVDYRTLAQSAQPKLELGGALVIEPPTPTMARSYLEAAGAAPALVSQASEAENVSIRSPLVLDLLIKISRVRQDPLLGERDITDPAAVLRMYVSSRLRLGSAAGQLQADQGKVMLTHLGRLAKAMEVAKITTLHNLYDWIRPSRQTFYVVTALVVQVAVATYQLRIPYAPVAGAAVLAAFSDTVESGPSPATGVALAVFCLVCVVLYRVTSQPIGWYVGSMAAATGLLVLVSSAQYLVEGWRTALNLGLGCFLAVVTWLPALPIYFLRGHGRMLLLAFVVRYRLVDGIFAGTFAMGAALVPLGLWDLQLPWLLAIYLGMAYPVALVSPMLVRLMIVDRAFLWGDAPMRLRPFMEACKRVGLIRNRGRKRIDYQFLHPTIQQYLAEGEPTARRSSEDEATV